MGYVPTILSYQNAFPTANSLARAFNGSSDYIAAGTPADATFQINTFTLSFWFRPKSAALSGGTYGLVCNLNGSNGGVGAELNSGKLLFESGAGSITGAASLSANVWYHYLITAGVSQTCTVYLNGVADGPPLSAGSSFFYNFGSVNTTLLFGAENKGSAGAVNDFANVDLEDIAMWNVFLSAGQIAQLAAGARANTIGANANLIGYWPITGGSPEPDKSGSGKNGVLTGTTMTLGPAVLGSGLALPQHKSGQTQVFNYLYPGAVQPNPRPPFSGPPSLPSYIAFQNQISFPQHLSGQSSVQSFLYPGALQPIIVIPTSPFTLMGQIVL
jgi:hypothetical protein